MKVELHIEDGKSELRVDGRNVPYRRIQIEQNFQINGFLPVPIIQIESYIKDNTDLTIDNGIVMIHGIPVHKRIARNLFKRLAEYLGKKNEEKCDYSDIKEGTKVYSMIRGEGEVAFNDTVQKVFYVDFFGHNQFDMQIGYDYSGNTMFEADSDTNIRNMHGLERDLFLSKPII